MADKDNEPQNLSNFLANYGIRREAGEEVDSATEWLMFLAEQTEDESDQEGGAE